MRLNRQSGAWLFVGALVSALAAGPALAQTGRQWIVFQNGRAFLVRPRRTTARNRRAGQAPKGPARMQGEAVVEIGSEVQALKERHAGFVMKLPQPLRRIEPRVTAAIDRFPLLTQYGYYTAIEDYATLGPEDQARVGSVMRSVAGLTPEAEQRLIAAATKQYEGPAPARGKEAVSAREERRELVRPYDLFFRLQNEVESPAHA